MKEAATILNGEARRAASILHQTPGWRWRRELCLTERSQQRQTAPTTKAWRRLPARQRRDACERDRQSTCEKQCQRPERNACRGGNVGRVRGIVWARAERTARAAWKGGACGLHRQARAGCTARTRSMREWTVLFQRTWQTTELQRQETCGQHRLGTRRWQRQSECGWHRQAASSGRVRVVPPGSDTWTSADSPIEAGPFYRSCIASPQRLMFFFPVLFFMISLFFVILSRYRA